MLGETGQNMGAQENGSGPRQGRGEGRGDREGSGLPDPSQSPSRKGLKNGGDGA
jgi:hypothetical protein